MDFDQQVLAEIRRVIASPEPAHKINTHLLSMMIWYRSKLLEQLLVQQASGAPLAVMNGVFKGLKLQLPLHAGIVLPMLLGTYESELHSFIAEAMTRDYAHIVNIGCGDGYYLVGMLRQMPFARGFGYDLNPEAQAGCRSVATLNDVAARLTVAGEFKGEDFAQHPAGKTLVICDIEGAEEELLNPALFPALVGHDILVEVHEVYRSGLTDRLRQRFATTHKQTFINHQPKRAPLPVGMQSLSELDEFLCVYEGRGGPTPWLVMQALK